VPVLILPIPEDFHELLENGCPAAIAFLCEPGRVMEMAVDLPIVFIIAILRAKDGRTQGAGEMIDVIFSVERRDV
jgi:hypothetical protein